MGRKKQNSVLTFTSPNASHTFNTYFTSIASKLILDTYPNSSNSDQSFRKYLDSTNANIHTKFVDSDFKIMDLNEIIMGLNNSKSTYYSPKVLKSVKALTLLFLQP